MGLLSLISDENLGTIEAKAVTIERLIYGLGPLHNIELLTCTNFLILQGIK